MRAEAPIMEQLPSIDSIMEGVANGSGQGETEKPAEVKQETKEDNLDRIEREQRHRREQFKLQQRIKELEGKQGNPSDKTSTIDLNAKNPFKEVVKAKNMTQDEIVRLALEAMDDDLSPEEKKEELKASTPEEIAKLVRKQMEEEKALEEKKNQESKAVTDFKANIAAEATKLAEKFPLVDSLGGSEQAYLLIEQQFLADSKEFGEEYAQENMMKIEDAIQKTNETLAITVKQALKSKYLKDFLLKAIKDESGEAEEQSDGDNQLKENEITLNNKAFSSGTEPVVKPNFKSNAEELDFLINKFI